MYRNSTNSTWIQQHHAVLAVWIRDRFVIASTNQIRIRLVAARKCESLI